ncbi:hypothetical protein DXV76_03635 [Rhodobacteraceae bacterium CCMM004]|nr:hypothetical protein DXV76_03635 [Rhodobacteraceae bacterium CCMM004]
MTNLTLIRPRPPRSLIDAAIERHGAMQVLLVAAAALMRRAALKPDRPPDARGLTRHVRRDIGLDPVPEAQSWQRHLM